MAWLTGYTAKHRSLRVVQIKSFNRKLTICITLLSKQYSNVEWMLTYLSIIGKSKSVKVESQGPHQVIISITRKRLTEIPLTRCLEPRAMDCQLKSKMLVQNWHTGYLKSRTAYSQYHAEKASWTLTYKLFKNQSSWLSASCRKIVLDPDLRAVQNPNHSIVSIMQKSPPRPWLTTCGEPRATHHQHNAKKAF